MPSRFSALTSLAAAAILLGSAVGAHAAGDPAAGEKKFYTCYGCHGLPNYRNAYPDYSVPMLRHQSAAYIVAALQAYRAGTRPHATMHAQAASLSDQDIDDIAAYLQAEPIKPATSAAGKKPAQVEACVACHGENGTGVATDLTPKPPVLAGQHVDYLEEALTAYKNGRRKSAVMNGMVSGLKNAEDIRIAAEYFASQKSELATATVDSK